MPKITPNHFNDSSVLHCDITLLELKQDLQVPENFKKSPYQSTVDGQWKDLFDDKIRSVEEAFMSLP